MIKNFELVKSALNGISELSESIKSIKNAQAKLFSIGDFKTYETAVRTEAELIRLRNQHVRTLIVMAQFEEQTNRLIGK